ncbi:MAG: hypothetical protein CMK00_01655 [Planctomycetes bacterium]|nr:hypothetical protein [Planctomycetota bacterium]
MELVEGVSLDRVINVLGGRAPEELTREDLADAISSHGLSSDFWRTQGGPSYVQCVVEIVCQVGAALEFAHAARVLHRDIKPGNIMLRPDGRTALTDFGLSREEDDPSLSRTGEFHGTPYYASPEQALSGRGAVDVRSDVYSLGVTLYELLTLQRPFGGTTPQEVFSGIVSKAPSNPRTFHQRLSEDLATIVMQAMDRDPDRRYQTAGAFVEDLHAFLEYRPVNARPLPFLVKLQRWGQREPLRVAVVCLAVIGLALTSTLLVRSERLRSRAEEAESNAIVERDRALAAEVRLIERNYQSELKMAMLAISKESYNEARSILADCEPELRNWVWGSMNVTLNSYLYELSIPALRAIHIGAPSSSENHTASTQAGMAPSVAVNYTGRVGAVASLDRVLTWDLATGEWQGELMTEGPLVLHLVFNPTRNEIATSQSDGVVSIWDVTEQKMLHRTSKHRTSVRSLAYSTDGRLLAVATLDSVQVWDADTMLLIHDFTELGSPETVAWIQGEEKLVVGARDGTVRVLDVNEAKTLWHGAAMKGSIEGVAVDPLTGGIYLGTEIGILGVWDKDSGELVREFNGRRQHVVSMAMAKGGGLLVAGGLRGNVVSYPEVEESYIGIPAHEGAVTGLALSPDGSKIVSAGTDGRICVWEASTGAEGHALHLHPGRIMDVAFDSSGERFMSLCEDSRIRFFDMDTGAGLFSVFDDSAPMALSVAPMGAEMVTGGQYGMLSVRECATGSPLRRRDLGRSMVPVVKYSPDGREILAGSTDGTLRLVRSHDLEDLWVQDGCAEVQWAEDIVLEPQDAADIQFSPDGKWFALNAGGRVITIRSAGTGKVVRRLEGHRGIVTSIAVSPNGTLLASSSVDQTVRLWDMENKAEPMILRGGGVPTSVAFSPDGSLVLSGDDAGIVSLWDTRSGQNLIGLEVDAHSVSWVGMSPDGATILSAYECGAMWACNSGLPRARAYWSAWRKTLSLKKKVDAIHAETLLPARREQLILSAEDISPAQRPAALALSQTIGGPDPEELNNVAWDVVDPAQPAAEEADKKLALEYARYAVDVAPENPYYLDTLAWACIANDRNDEALELSRKALEHAQEQGEEELAVQLEASLSLMEEKAAGAR